MKRQACFALAALVLASSAGAREERIADPTRPPAAMSAPAAPGAGAGAVAGPRVQSILVSLRPGGRRIAVIDGKTLREGARLGDAVLESIHPTEVVLRRGKQRQVLKLFQPAAPVAAI